MPLKEEEEEEVKLYGFYHACCEKLIAFRKDRRKDAQTEHREAYMWIRGMNFIKKGQGKTNRNRPYVICRKCNRMCMNE